MNERTTRRRISGTAIFSGVLTATLTALAFNVGFGVVRGDWNPGQGSTVADIVATQSLGLAFVAASAFVVSLVLLSPIFIVTALLGLWRVPHTINAGLFGGTLLFGIAVVGLPQISGSLLLQVAVIQFSTALFASFAFRHVSLRNRNA